MWNAATDILDDALNACGLEDVGGRDDLEAGFGVGDQVDRGVQRASDPRVYAGVGQEAFDSGPVVGRPVGVLRLFAGRAVGAGEDGRGPCVDVGVDVDGGDGAVD